MYCFLSSWQLLRFFLSFQASFFRLVLLYDLIQCFKKCPGIYISWYPFYLCSAGIKKDLCRCSSYSEIPGLVLLLIDIYRDQNEFFVQYLYHALVCESLCLEFFAPAAVFRSHIDEYWLSLRFRSFKLRLKRSIEVHSFEF